MGEVKVEFRDLAKSFSGSEVLKSVSFAIQKGTFHALLGENGAGKSTLLKLLVGLLEADSGEIRIDGQTIEFRNPREASAAGLAMVFQNLSLVPTLSIEENLRLGPMARSSSGQWDEFATRFPFLDSPRRLVGELSMGERQILEIVRALRSKPSLLILDEPTAQISPQEGKLVLELAASLRDSGTTVVFVTHRLQEVLDYADCVSVLRKGMHVGTLMRAQASIEYLSNLMVGASLDSPVTHARSTQQWKPVLEISDLRVPAIAGSNGALGPLNLTVGRNEVVGIAGVSGNGQGLLTDVLTGQHRRFRGAIRLLGAHYDYLRCPGKVAYIPEDSLRDGVAENLPLLFNLMSDDFRSRPFSSRGLLSWCALEHECQRRLNAFAIEPNDLRARSGDLSGGNLKRLILARELSGRPDLVVAVNPTAGLDFRSARQIHELLLDKARSGCAVLLISSDLDEILALSDRVVVIFGGRLVASLPREEARRDTVGALMGGAETAAGRAA